MRKEIFIAIFISLILSRFNAIGQVKLSAGASFLIENGTKLTFQSANDSLILNDSSIIENNGIILFLNHTKIFEQSNFPVKGNGHEISITDSTESNWQNPGNLGFEFNVSDTNYSRSVYRFHTDTLISVNSFNSVKRYYRVFPMIDKSAEIRLKVDSTELNGLISQDLKLVTFTDTNAINLGGYIDNDSLFVYNNTDSIGIFTLTSSLISIDNVSPLQICTNDTIWIEFSKTGMFNTGNEFILSLVNSNDTIVLDTVSNTGTYFYYINDSIQGGEYNAVVSVNEIESIAIYDSIITFYNLPNIQFSNITPLCLNGDSLLLTSALPIGGNYSGNAIYNEYFRPDLSGIGTFTYFYSYTDTNGCFSNDSSEITVNNIPMVTFSSLSDLCSNDTLYTLSEGQPLGGIYSGAGIIGDDFDPTIGSGIHLLTYSITDTNNCSNSDTSTIEVLATPTVNFSNLNDLCSNDTLQVLTEGLPSGGFYSGTGIIANDFDPSIGAGNYILTYSFTDLNNCSNSDTSEIEVFEAPIVPIVTQNINTLSTDPAISYQWYLNGTVISGAITQNYDPLVEGDYQVEISNSNSCSEISTPFTFVFNSINDLDLSGNISIYPNPSTGFISIQFFKIMKFELSIHDINGKIIHQEIMNGNSTLDLNEFPNGLYLLNFSGEEFFQTVKIILEK